MAYYLQISSWMKNRIQCWESNAEFLRSTLMFWSNKKRFHSWCINLKNMLKLVQICTTRFLPQSTQRPACLQRACTTIKNMAKTNYKKLLVVLVKNSSIPPQEQWMVVPIRGKTCEGQLHLFHMRPILLKFILAHIRKRTSSLKPRE